MMSVQESKTSALKGQKCRSGQDHQNHSAGLENRQIAHLKKYIDHFRYLC
jgi:hypothetical protein